MPSLPFFLFPTFEYEGNLLGSGMLLSIYMKVERQIPAEPPMFEGCYVRFDAVMSGFQGGCMPIIGLD